MTNTTIYAAGITVDHTAVCYSLQLKRRAEAELSSLCAHARALDARWHSPRCLRGRRHGSSGPRLQSLRGWHWLHSLHTGCARDCDQADHGSLSSSEHRALLFSDANTRHLLKTERIWAVPSPLQQKRREFALSKFRSQSTESNLFCEFVVTTNLSWDNVRRCWIGKQMPCWD